ncbi:dihydroorotate oxidase [Blattabacterium cuenoti]|uniref:dihydroorotate oxidase n=1 Tax=Blattabacterium cuenoti TaxID=1653831 RepID=UPI00163C8AD4|nr:dihydroorotate oxidase [Blattabacterium cuenoti]
MKKIDLSTNINGIKLSLCIMNASGALCCTYKDLYNLLNSSSGAIVTKSCTKNPRIGNLSPRYIEWNIGSINSMGLPNLGIDFYLDFFRKKKNNKPVFLSISGLSIKENYFLIKKASSSSNIDALEINLSCPNIIENNEILGYNFNYVSKFLENIFKFNNDKPIGLKLPPYFNNIHIEIMSSIISKFPISFITCINSLPYGLVIDSYKESTVIFPNNGIGGIGGKIIKPFALSNIFNFYSILKNKVSIIGCGGITSGKDIFDHILCGATAVQIGTEFVNKGVVIFDKLKKEFTKFLLKKGYSSLDEFRGNLKQISSKL